MSEKGKPLAYFYRGQIERGGPKNGYRWMDGWSARGKCGGVLYPWVTRAEARTEATRRGRYAVFVREERDEFNRIAVVDSKGNIEYVGEDELEAAENIFDNLKVGEQRQTEEPG